jgi:GNAT superfamily N-acetyltransferase
MRIPRLPTGNERAKMWRRSTMNDVSIRRLCRDDTQVIAGAFALLGWSKTVEQYERYLAEQEAGSRVCYVAEQRGQFAGYCTLLWESSYEPFLQAGIPEVNDLNVLPDFRNQGIGNALLDAVESTAGDRSRSVGLGVGLYRDYGAAQRIYVRRGYLPDGQGVMYANKPVTPGDTIRIDDDALLMFTRTIQK